MKSENSGQWKWKWKSKKDRRPVLGDMRKGQDEMWCGGKGRLDRLEEGERGKWSTERGNVVRPHGRDMLKRKGENGWKEGERLTENLRVCWRRKYMRRWKWVRICEEGIRWSLIIRTQGSEWCGGWYGCLSGSKWSETKESTWLIDVLSTIYFGYFGYLRQRSDINAWLTFLLCCDFCLT